MKLISALLAVFLCLASCSGNNSLSNDRKGAKAIPPSVENAARKALAAYPELRDVPIEFVYKDGLGSHFMQAQPKVSTLFKSGTERTYLIKMTREMKISDEEKIPISEIPEKVLIGWFAHELGHIVDYLDESTLEMAWFGVKYYLSEDFKARAEREADVNAIRAGFSTQIIATKHYILNNASLPAEYLQKIERLYLSPASVLEIVEELEEEEAETMEEVFEEG